MGEDESDDGHQPSDEPREARNVAEHAVEQAGQPQSGNAVADGDSEEDEGDEGDEASEEDSEGEEEEP
jgi:hypothetical protein